MILIKIILESLLDSYNKGKCKELSEKEENELLETLIKFKDKFEYKQDETLSTEEASIYLNITRPICVRRVFLQIGQKCYDYL